LTTKARYIVLVAIVRALQTNDNSNWMLSHWFYFIYLLQI